MSAFLARLSPRTDAVGEDYVRSEVGQALVGAGLITGCRIYPRPRRARPTSMGRRLRAVALSSRYVELDGKDAFHRFTPARTRDPMTRRTLDTLIEDGQLKEDLAAYYFGARAAAAPDGAALAKVKSLLRAVSNGGSTAAWRRLRYVAEDLDEHEFVLDLVRVMRKIKREFASTSLGRKAVAFIAERFPDRRRPASTWKSFLLQADEYTGLRAKLRTATAAGTAVAPLLHDAIFVCKSSTARLEALRRAMCRGS
jgi:hypothetical protein